MSIAIFLLAVIQIVGFIALIMLVISSISYWRQSSKFAKEARELAEQSMEHWEKALQHWENSIR